MKCSPTINNVCTLVVLFVQNLRGIFCTGFPTPTARVAPRTAPATPRQSAPLGAGNRTELVPTALGSAAHVKPSIAYIGNCNNCCNFFTVTLDCGGISSENCTHFDSASPAAGECSVTICPCRGDICQVLSLKQATSSNHLIKDFLPHTSCGLTSPTLRSRGRRPHPYQL